jgi:hypothetical protein
MVVEETIPLMDGKEGVKETPPITLDDEGIGPPIHKPLTPDIV